MGCRTQSYGASTMRDQRSIQQNRRPVPTVEGTAVRKSASQIQPQTRIRPHRRKVSISGSKALRRQKAVLILLGVIGSIILVGLSGIMLTTMDASTTLAEEVRAKEDELDQLVIANDAREYEIGNSVDLNYIIEVATQELGMVRSNLSQVVTFRTKDTEYLQQVARVPVE